MGSNPIWDSDFFFSESSFLPHSHSISCCCCLSDDDEMMRMKSKWEGGGILVNGSDVGW